MISAEMVLIFGVCVFVLAMGLGTFYRSTWMSLVLYGVSVGLCSWVLVAANVRPPANEVTYHTVQHRILSDGTAIDYIIVQDEAGKDRTVNINEALGIKVPDNGKSYSIARVRYRRSVLGLVFNYHDSYKVVPQS